MMMMMISANSCAVFFLLEILFISSWVDHVNSLHCNHHLPISRTTQQYRYSERHRSTATRVDLIWHTRSSSLSLHDFSILCLHKIERLFSLKNAVLNYFIYSITIYSLIRYSSHNILLSSLIVFMLPCLLIVTRLINLTKHMHVSLKHHHFIEIKHIQV